MGRQILIILVSFIFVGVAQAETLFTCKDLSQSRRTISATYNSDKTLKYYFLNTDSFHQGHSKRVFFGDSSDKTLSIIETEVEFKIERVEVYKFITTTKSLVLDKETDKAVYEYVKEYTDSKRNETYKDIIRRDNLYNCQDFRNRL